jgi:hypothetical protein
MALVLAAAVFGQGCVGDSGGSDPLPTGSETPTSIAETSPIGTSADGLCVDVELETPTRCPVSTHCGVSMFSSRVNGRWWVTDEGAGTLDYSPPAWGTYENPPEAVTVTVTEHPEPILVAELNGHAVTSRPIPDAEFQGCA